MGFKIDIHYECGYKDTRVLSYQHLRGIKYKGQRPIKLVCHFMPDLEFTFKYAYHCLHPIKRIGVFVLVDGEEIEAKSRYKELQTLELLGVI